MQIHVEIDPTLTAPEINVRAPAADDQLTALIQALEELTTSTATLAVSQQGRTLQLPLTDIIFIEASGHDVRVHTRTEAFKTTTRLYELAEQLPATFLRVSKSAIVNTDAVYALTKSLTGNLIEFQHTHKQLYASRRYYQQLKTALMPKES
ncbi:LytTR family DNA-binding domain-containing protein [Lactiplantibacillus daowaiensis]|uniref:LytTR family DNA-binding domain-containing protein n=1 Tax=Lactiplantibacillus daowaiensis TaxID=2559918 RepID=A0ABW1S0C7_9LACO|nr:LytTR family DNA-binding domain-containing protein [Lactiplantibacillus daowaiensis]